MARLEILIVDDDRDMAQSLAEVLRDAGHTITLGYSGAQALELFREHFYDLVLMDIRMPGMSGIETLMAIKKEKPAARVLLMTGFSVEQVLDKARNEGALGILHKPIHPADLLETLQQVDPQAAVLLVDDDEDFSAAVAASLRENGYRVIVARDGESALSIADTHPIEAMILDLCLPELSGLDTYLEMKKRGSNAPTVVVSGYLDKESRQLKDLQQQKVSHILRKPVDVDLLVRMLNDVAKDNNISGF